MNRPSTVLYADDAAETDGLFSSMSCMSGPMCDAGHEAIPLAFVTTRNSPQAAGRARKLWAKVARLPKNKDVLSTMKDLVAGDGLLVGAGMEVVAGRSDISDMSDRSVPGDPTGSRRREFCHYADVPSPSV